MKTILVFLVEILIVVAQAAPSFKGLAPEIYIPKRDYNITAECGTGIKPGSNSILTRWPYIQSVTENSAVIVFGTRSTVRSASVAYSTNSLYRNVAQATLKVITAPTFGTMYLWTATLTNLPSDTFICYKAYSDNLTELAGAIQFKTAPSTSSTADFAFMQFADFGKNNQAQKDIYAQMQKYTDVSDFIITSGDNCYEEGTHAEWQSNVFDIHRDQWTQIPLFLSPGNHEYYTPNAQPYLDNFRHFNVALRPADNGRYYSFNWGPVHFVALDSEESLNQCTQYPTTGMCAWLEKDLEANTKKITIAFWHHPPYTGMPTRGDDTRVITNLMPIMEKYRVPLVINGHHHFYERFQPRVGTSAVPTLQGGVTYITSGGGGDDLYDIGPESLQAKVVRDWEFLYVVVSGCRINVKAINRSNSVIDDHNIDVC